MERQPLGVGRGIREEDVMGDDDKMRTIDELMWRLSTPEKLQVAADMVEKANARERPILMSGGAAEWCAP